MITQGGKQGLHRSWLNLLAITLFFVNTSVVRAEETAVDGAEKEVQAGKSLIQRFLEFTGDKNVMGKAKSGDGKVVLSGNKTKFNGDDGQSYKSDLTYHDFSFKTPDEEAAKQDPKNDKAKSRELMPFVSAHGGISAGGGSSLLERTVYEEHKKYSQQEEDPEQAKKQEEQEGVKYRSVFKITTQEVFDKGVGNGAGGNGAGAGGGANGAGNGGNKDQKEKDKVERMELRPEVAKKVEEVGTQSAQTIERSARDKGSEDDENQMGNILFYYEAGSRAAAAWADSTRANLTQRRVFKEVSGGGTGFNVTLSEDTPTCDKWGESVQAEIQKSQDANDKKRKQEELQKMVEKCKKMAAQPFTAVDPRFQKAENGGGNGGGNGGDGGEETIKEQGAKKEDPLARDLRNQLTVIEKAGASPNNQPTNWKYEAKDEKSKYSIVDAEGNVTGTEEKTVPQVMEEYNQQLEESIKSYEEVKKVYPELEFDAEKAKSYALKPEEQSAADIMKRPVQQALEEEAGVQAQEEKQAPENYDQLLQKTQQ